jgi:hypothetical protein
MQVGLTLCLNVVGSLLDKLNENSTTALVESKLFKRSFEK